MRKLPGAVNSSPAALRYGLSKSRALWDWFTASVQGQVSRKNVSIIMLENDGATEVMRWNLLNSWPSGWQSASLDASGDELAIESITFAFDSLERA